MDEKDNYTEKLSSDSNQRSCDTKNDCGDELKPAKERQSLEDCVDNNTSHDCDKNACKGNLKTEYEIEFRIL